MRRDNELLQAATANEKRLEAYYVRKYMRMIKLRKDQQMHNKRGINE